MSKSSKHKKAKVPRLTEAEYAEYILSLKNDGEEPSKATMSATNEQKLPLKFEKT